MTSPRPRLRICVYYPWLYLTSGSERTIVEIARRSRHEISIVTNEYQPDATFPELQALNVTVLSRVPVKRTIGAVAVAAWSILRQRLDVRRYDALLVVCEGLGDLVALRHPDLPAFCLCLTPLRIAFDPEYRRAYFSGRPILQSTAVRLGAAAFRMVDRIAWKRYRRVFPISAEIQRRIVSGRLAGPDRLQVLHPGVDTSRYRGSPVLRERIFFVPGRIMWTKNLELAIDAFKRFKATAAATDWRLWIAGIVDRKSTSYLDALRARAGSDPAVEFHVRPSDEWMVDTYRRCHATLFTAFNEDWGLVIIEAMAAGTPVIAFNRGGPREIVRHEVDGLLAEGTPEAFAAAMVRLVEERGLYDRLAGATESGAARFGWTPFVDALDRAIEESCAQGRAMANTPG